MSFKKFIKELNGSRVEGELIKTVFYSLLTSLFVAIIIYYIFLGQNTLYLSKYGFYIFFVLLSYAMIVPTIRQVRAYNQFNCMSGMMIGMTAGMMAGFLSGYFVGATNGMFFGSVFGMFVGIVLGIWMGLSCGIMGFMEGIMAGFMGGLMGAMTAIMVLNDHLKLMGVIVFIICSIILIALNYMIYTETKETERQRKESHLVAVVLSGVLTLITILFMIFGPKGGVFN